MQFKPITAIVVLLLVITSLSIAGCTTPMSTTTHHTGEGDVIFSYPRELKPTSNGDYWRWTFKCTVKNQCNKSITLLNTSYYYFLDSTGKQYVPPNWYEGSMISNKVLNANGGTYTYDHEVNSKKSDSLFGGSLVLLWKFEDTNSDPQINALLSSISRNSERVGIPLRSP